MDSEGHRGAPVSLRMLVLLFFLLKNIYLLDFLGGAVVKNLPADVGDIVSIPGSGRSPGVGNGNLLQYSCLENFMDRGAKGATVHG